MYTYIHTYTNMQTDIHKQTSIRAFLNTYMHIRTQQSCSSFLQSESQVLEHEFECMYFASMKTMRIQHDGHTPLFVNKGIFAVFLHSVIFHSQGFSILPAFFVDAIIHIHTNAHT